MQLGLLAESVFFGDVGRVILTNALASRQRFLTAIRICKQIREICFELLASKRDLLASQHFFQIYTWRNHVPTDIFTSTVARTARRLKQAAEIPPQAKIVIYGGKILIAPERASPDADVFYALHKARESGLLQKFYLVAQDASKPLLHDTRCKVCGEVGRRRTVKFIEFCIRHAHDHVRLNAWEIAEHNFEHYALGD